MLNDGIVNVLGLNFFYSNFLYSSFVTFLMLKNVFLKTKKRMFPPFFVFKKEGKRNFFYFYDRFDVDKKNMKKIKIINMFEEEGDYKNKIDINEMKNLIDSEIQKMHVHSMKTSDSLNTWLKRTFNYIREKDFLFVLKSSKKSKAFINLKE